MTGQRVPCRVMSCLFLGMLGCVCLAFGRVKKNHAREIISEHIKAIEHVISLSLLPTPPPLPRVRTHTHPPTRARAHTGAKYLMVSHMRGKLASMDRIKVQLWDV